MLGSGGNSGFQALNLVLQLGARRVVLVGFDMSIDAGVHWHGRHPGSLANPTLFVIRRWIQALDRAVGDLAAIGVDVVNASPTSRLTGFRKAELVEALDAWSSIDGDPERRPQ